MQEIPNQLPDPFGVERFREAIVPPLDSIEMQQASANLTGAVADAFVQHAAYAEPVHDVLNLAGETIQAEVVLLQHDSNAGRVDLNMAVGADAQIVRATFASAADPIQRTYDYVRRSEEAGGGYLRYAVDARESSSLYDARHATAAHVVVASMLGRSHGDGLLGEPVGVTEILGTPVGPAEMEYVTDVTQDAGPMQFRMQDATNRLGTLRSMGERPESFYRASARGAELLASDVTRMLGDNPEIEGAVQQPAGRLVADVGHEVFRDQKTSVREARPTIVLRDERTPSERDERWFAANVAPHVPGVTLHEMVSQYVYQPVDDRLHCIATEGFTDAAGTLYGVEQSDVLCTDTDARIARHIALRALSGGEETPPVDA
ncbi:MAG TPA: hypothetical protein VJP80_04810 [Candidatus Saccharimonadales bacterium]|nr:hypothetical protein [Candidatus Saccharimonadales bacterium]